MPTDYEQRMTDRNAQLAAALRDALGVYVWVDRHGVAHINADALLHAVTLTAKEA